MANLAKFRKARTIVRRNGGIPKLIDLLDIDLSKVRNTETMQRRRNTIYLELGPNRKKQFLLRGWGRRMAFYCRKIGNDCWRRLQEKGGSFCRSLRGQFQLT